MDNESMTVFATAKTKERKKERKNGECQLKHVKITENVL